MKIAIVNGPNLNLIGTREPSIYGNQSLSSYLSSLTSNTPIEISIFQSNIEGEIIDYLQNTLVDGFIINAGGYSHTSVAIRDCISSIISPVVEVHISNITSRESFRHESLLSPVCEGCIFGFGLESYRLALNYFENKTVK
jgi:3-dehydroquinate dehydratase-2